MMSMNKDVNKDKSVKQEQTSAALPGDAKMAVLHMIKISQALLDIAHKESTALVQKDLVTFAILQEEKESLTHKYVAASKEFRMRMQAFRKIDKALLKKLEHLQNEIAAQARANNVIVLKIRDDAERITQGMIQPINKLGKRAFIEHPTTQGEHA